MQILSKFLDLANIVDGVNCFEQKYDETIDRLVFGTGESECKAAETNDVDHDTTPNHFWASETLNQAVESTSESVYFPIDSCGLQSQCSILLEGFTFSGHELCVRKRTGQRTIILNILCSEDTGDFIEFTTSVSTDFRTYGFMVMGPALTPVEISCKYSKTVASIQFDMQPDIDTGSDTR